MQTLDDVVNKAISQGLTMVSYRLTPQGWSYTFSSDQGELIDPDHPGVALGVAFMKEETAQLLSGIQGRFTQHGELKNLSDAMSKEMLGDWGITAFNFASLYRSGILKVKP